MAIDLKRSYSTEAKEHGLSTAAVLGEEGQVLVYVTDSSGVSKVEPSSGVGGEMFAGFSETANSVRTTEVVVEDLTVPAAPGPYTLALSKSALTATGVAGMSEISIVASVTGTLVQNANGGAAPGPGEFEVDPTSGIVTFHAILAGEDVHVIYRHDLTQVEIDARYQGRHVNNLTANSQTRSVSVKCGRGEIYTDQFNAAHVYALEAAVLTQPDGKVGIGGAGSAVGEVCALPSSNAGGFLGVRFRSR
jgi:hypothetical protein